MGVWAPGPNAMWRRLTEAPQLMKFMATPPTKTVTAYKLFDVKPDGTLHSLKIDKTTVQPMGAWIEGEKIVTKGLSPSHPGYHAGQLPIAPHLRGKPNTPESHIQPNRVWAEVELSADTDFSAPGDVRSMPEVPLGGYYRWKRGTKQGGTWLIAGGARIVRVLSNQEVAGILRTAGIPEDEIAREQGPAADKWAEKINNAAVNSVIRKAAGRG